jgi:hypothetical protein
MMHNFEWVLGDGFDFIAKSLSRSMGYTDQQLSDKLSDAAALPRAHQWAGL